MQPDPKYSIENYIKPGSIIIEPETVELMELVRSKYPDQAEYFNFLVNREIRKAFIDGYKELLDSRSETNLREVMRVKYASH